MDQTSESVVKEGKPTRIRVTSDPRSKRPRREQGHLVQKDRDEQSEEEVLGGPVVEQLSNHPPRLSTPPNIFISSSSTLLEKPSGTPPDSPPRQRAKELQHVFESYPNDLQISTIKSFEVAFWNLLDPNAEKVAKFEAQLLLFLRSIISNLHLVQWKAFTEDKPQLPPWLLEHLYGSTSFSDVTAAPSLTTDENILTLVRGYAIKSPQTMEVARILEHLIHYSIVRSSTSIKEESHVFLYDEFKLFNRLTSNFDSPYIGEGVDQFERKVIRVYSNLFENQDGSGKKHYGRIIPIVQSSGTGKSRLVYELRKRWPTQSVCFRRNPSNPNLGFPLQDASVVDFFISPKHLNKDPNLLVAALVAAWLHQMTDTMITEATRMSELFDDWDHSDTKADGSRVPNLRRRRNFERVAQLASGWVETYPDLLQKNLNAIPEAGSDGLPLGRDAMMSLGPVKLLVQEKLEKFQDQLLSLVVVQNAMKSHGMSELPHVFFAFDECLLLQELREQQALSNRSSTTPELKLIHICRSFQIMDEFLKPKIRIWLLLLGTNSSLGKMLAMQEAEQSERGRSALRLPPWWQLPFDPLLPQIPQPRTPADVLKIDQLKYYGRPMWAGRDAHELVLVASYKLECRSDGPMKDELYRAKVQALTLLSQRVCIDIVPLRFEGDEIRNIAADAVERQMRILSSYSTDNVITTKALPESLLSLGAWFKLTSSDLGDMNYGKVLKILRENLLHDSSIDLKGVNGELFGRLLLTMAHDQTPTWKGLRVARQILVAPAVCIPSFVVTLLGTEGGTSAVKELTSLIGLNLDETHLNFTNFDTVCVPKDQVSSSFLWKCWKRGTAVQCAPGQNGVDLILPVLVGKLDLDLDGPEKVKIEEHMTYIGVQVKNRLQAVQKNACFHGPYLSRGWTHQALFSLVLDLGTETTFNESNVSAHVKVSMSSCDDSERTAAVHFAAGQTPMPCIHVRSCSPDVYPCLTDLDPFGHFSSMVRMKREVETGFYESFTNKAWLEEN